MAVRALSIQIALTAGLLVGQQTSSDKGKQTPKPKEAPKQESGGLFKNKLGYKSSKQNKDSMTLGFNGIDPSGRVDRETLAKEPGGEHRAAVTKMDSSRPNDAELRAFLREGGLR